MDLEEAFWQKTLETVKTLVRRNIGAQTWNDDNGKTIEGWCFRTSDYGPKMTGTPGQGYWQESWGHTDYVLTTNGEYWIYQFSGEDEHGREETQLVRLIREMPRGQLVGSAGKPFSQLQSEIERFAYM